MLNILKSQDLTLPATPEQWLHELQQPTAIEIIGKQSDQWRVISVLIHGNEPSGFYATYNFLKQGLIPETNLSIIISSVRAARHEPLFTHRYMPGEYDLNRRFGIIDCHDRVTELAIQITEYIRTLSPQFIVDLHNTSGQSPAFCVSISSHPSIHKIASLFTKEIVVTQLVIGSLMEQNFNCPITTIECGGSQNDKSHNVALKGLTGLALVHDINDIDANNMDVYNHPVRVRVHAGISLDYGDQADTDVDITLINKIENLNQDVTTAGSHIGWLDRSLTDCLLAINDHGEDIITHLFHIEDGKLLAQRDIKIFMATRRADIAMDDCLFYVVEA